MKVIELEAPGKFRLAERNYPEIEPDELILRTKAVSVCSTDVSYFHGNLNPPFYPIILGHEYTGTVVEVGKQQNRELIGKRIVYFGQSDFGGFAEYRTLRPIFAGNRTNAPFLTERYFKDDYRAASIVVPEDIIDEYATLIEPTTAVLRAIMVHPPHISDHVLVLGGGPCGAIACSIIKMMYAVDSITVLEKNEFRNKLCRDNFCDTALPSVYELTERTRSDNIRYNYIFDALPPLSYERDEMGVDPRQAAMRVATPGAMYVLYGASQKLQSIDTWLILAKGLRLSSAAFDVDLFPMHKSASVMTTALELLRRKIVDPSIFITRQIHFGNLPAFREVFDEYRHCTQMKTVVEFKQ